MKLRASTTQIWRMGRTPDSSKVQRNHHRNRWAGFRNLKVSCFQVATEKNTPPIFSPHLANELPESWRWTVKRRWNSGFQKNRGENPGWVSPLVFSGGMFFFLKKSGKLWLCSPSLMRLSATSLNFSSQSDWTDSYQKAKSGRCWKYDRLLRLSLSSILLLSLLSLSLSCLYNYCHYYYHVCYHESWL